MCCAENSLEHKLPVFSFTIVYNATHHSQPLWFHTPASSWFLSRHRAGNRVRKWKHHWHFHHWGKIPVFGVCGEISPMVKLGLGGCLFMEGVSADKPLLSAETVTGGVHVPLWSTFSCGQCSGSGSSGSRRGWYSCHRPIIWEVNGDLCYNHNLGCPLYSWLKRLVDAVRYPKMKSNNIIMVYFF